jgi:16S rRNA (cytosine967-C5)-methyltransferase
VGDQKRSAPEARQIAGAVLERVERDRAFAAAALDAELGKHPQLSARDRALATELVYGVLRTRGALFERLSRHATRGLQRVDSRTLTQLLLASYQMLVLERIPPYAAVDAAVDAVRRTRGPRLAGFANALLRKLAASGERVALAAAVRESAPSWLTARLEAAVGKDETTLLLGVETAPLAVRLARGVSPPEWIAAANPGRASPLARLVRAEGEPRRLPGYAEGALVIQEEGAQVVALALGVRPGERVLDACAGRGQKSSLLAEQLANSGELWATDLYPAKLRLLNEEFERLKLPAARTAAVDWTVGPGAVPDGFDRVLVDAPCTGVGTLRRRPEIALRLGPEDPARLAELQRRILRGAAERARPGGSVVYAVCSVLEEECEDVVESVRDVLSPAPFAAPELAWLSPETTQFRLLPGRHGTDGYFVASFVRGS